MASQFTSNQEKKKKKQETRKMAKGSTTRATELKSGRDGCTPCSRLRAFVSFEDEEEHDKTPAPEPGAATPETATLSSGLSGATKSLSRNLAAELDDVAGQIRTMTTLTMGRRF
ncbi:hypothetical protein GQ600_15079 [Phytophthora cactorum]|nr:hypothetical protein GQ600_15079 [Phytophthora cactorum]